MNFNNKYFKNVIIFLIFIALVVFVFIVDKNVSKDNIISKGVSTVVNPISGFFRNIGSSLREKMGGLSDEEIKDIDELNLKVKKLEEENRKLREVVIRSEALQNEYDMIKSSNFELIAADITSLNNNSWYDVFTINKGLKDGVEMGDSVVMSGDNTADAMEGLVGRVTGVYSDYSEITAITDDTVRVSIRTLRSGDGGILSGMKSGELKAYMFDQNSDVIVGDEIITSGLGGVIKKDIFVGEVSKVETDDTEMKKLVYIKPGVDFKHLRRVYVVK